MLIIIIFLSHKNAKPFHKILLQYINNTKSYLLALQTCSSSFVIKNYARNTLIPINWFILDVFNLFIENN